MKTLTLGDVTYEVVDEQSRKDISTNTSDIAEQKSSIRNLTERMVSVEEKAQAASDHANAKGSQYASGLYKIATNSSGHVTGATPVTASDITSLGLPQADWNQTDSSATDYIENKPDIKNGAGSNSIVLATGDAKGSYSVAGGTNDKNLVADLAGSLLAYLTSIDKPTAYGDMSLSFGAGTKSYSTGSVALGANSTAGCLGFYWYNIDFSSANPVITLSTTQHSYTLLGRLRERTWTSDATTQLANWKVGDAITIVNNIKYGEKAVVTAVDSTNGKITVQSLPFTSVSMSAVGSLAYMFDDCAVYNPSKPSAGIVQFALGGLSIGLQTNASGTFSMATGYQSKVTTDFGYAEGYQTVADYSAHSEGYKTQAPGRCSHSEGNRTVAKGLQSHAEGQYTYAGGVGAHAEGYNPWEDSDKNSIDITLYGAHGTGAHSEGYNTLAKSVATHAEGYKTVASGYYAHAEGENTNAQGNASHAEGLGTIAGKVQHVQGKYNIADTTTNNGYGKYAHIVGNGTSDTARSNAHTVDWDGNAWYAGTVEATAIILKSSTTGSTKRFQITVDDNGELTTTAI